MTVTKDEARRIAEIFSEQMRKGSNDHEEDCRRIVAEIPHATRDDLIGVTEALLDESAEAKAEAEAEIAWAEMSMRVMERAVEITGNQEITTEEAATLMAPRGDKEADAILRWLNDPERKRLDAEYDAAIAAHPDWWETPDQIIHNKPDSPEDTPEKLLAWYRRLTHPSP